MARQKKKTKAKIEKIRPLESKESWPKALISRLQGVKSHEEAVRVIVRFFSECCEAGVLDDLFRQNSTAAARIYLRMLSPEELAATFPSDVLQEILVRKLIAVCGGQSEKAARLYDIQNYSALLLIGKNYSGCLFERIAREFLRDQREESFASGSGSVPSTPVGGLTELAHLSDKRRHFEDSEMGT